MKQFFLLFFIIFSSILLGEEKDLSSTTEVIDIEKVSEAMGFLLGEKLQNLGLPYDINSVVKGLEKVAKDNQKTLTRENYIQAINFYVRQVYTELGRKNLAQAEQFLKENTKNTEVVEVIPGKLQYQTTQKGKGVTLQPYHSLTMKYTGKYLDGTIFSHTEESLFSYQELYEGFAKGIEHMKEGEKRTLYIHPELGNCIKSDLSPNALLTFEIELIKIHHRPSSLPSHKKEIAKDTFLR